MARELPAKRPFFAARALYLLLPNFKNEPITG